MKVSVVVYLAPFWFGLIVSCDAFACTPSRSTCASRRRGGGTDVTKLYAEQDNKKGVYARPSAAIERGSGFFIPGLEGPRVRLLFGVAVLVLTAINHTLGDSRINSATSSNEILAVGYSILLLLQAAIEYGKDEKGYVLSLDRPDVFLFEQSNRSLLQAWDSGNFSPEWKDKVRWAAATYIALTPANTILLLDTEKVIYRLGSGSVNSNADDEATGCKAAIEALTNVKSGRVSLPASHPAVTSLVPPDYQGRCVILQSINSRQCWMVSSDQLIQAFSNKDLKWLGQLACFVEKCDTAVLPGKI